MRNVSNLLPLFRSMQSDVCHFVLVGGLPIGLDKLASLLACRLQGSNCKWKHGSEHPESNESMLHLRPVAYLLKSTTSTQIA